MLMNSYRNASILGSLSRRGIGQSGEVPLENASGPTGPPNSVVIVDSGGGVPVAAQLDAQGNVKSMWQVGSGTSTGGSMVEWGNLIGSWVSQNPMLAFGIGGVMLALIFSSFGRRR